MILTQLNAAVQKAIRLEIDKYIYELFEIVCFMSSVLLS